MTPKTQSLRDRLRFFKGPALIVLMLMGFILEFVVELPFRIMAIAAGGRRSS